MTDKIRDEIKAKLIALKLNMTEVSRALGRNDAYIQQFLERGAPQYLKERERRKLSSLLGIDETKLMQPDDERISNAAPKHKDSVKMIRHSTADGVFGEDTVPILGHANGSPDAIMIDFDNELGQAARHPNLKGIKDGFALYAAGDSMSPRYKSGELVYVAFNRPPLPGQDCVVEMNNGEGYVKEFGKRTLKDIICKQHNPAKEWKRALSDVKAIHAVVGRG